MMERMFSWLRRAPADEVAELIQSAIDADTAGRYQAAVDLYAKGIEKMMAMLKDINGEDAQRATRLKIDEYMTRAELLKTHLAQKRQPLVPVSRSQSTANNSAILSRKDTDHNSSSCFVRSHPQLAHTVLDEVLDRSPGVKWDDIAGLGVAKQILQEAVILPMLRPDLFTGLRAPPRGVLLFGPPGTGKTLLAKAVASESNATFFNISASTLTSKWVGEGEKLVRVLFAMARELQPSVIFLDEMDALLGSRSASEHDASRRMKNQFFMELDGAVSATEDRILVMGATNLPQELDEAIIRRLEKRIFVPLPDDTSREHLVRHLIKAHKTDLPDRDLRRVVKATDGYSGSDLRALCKDAALGPIRDLGMRIAGAGNDDIRAINISDFQVALQRVRASVSKETVQSLSAWNSQYGISAAS